MPALNLFPAVAYASAPLATKSTIFDSTLTFFALTVEPSIAAVEALCSLFHIAEPEISRCNLSKTSPTLFVALSKNFLFSHS